MLRCARCGAPIAWIRQRGRPPERCSTLCIRADRAAGERARRDLLRSVGLWRNAGKQIARA